MTSGTLAPAPCRARGLTAPGCTPWVSGSHRIDVESCYCFAGILCFWLLAFVGLLEAGAGHLCHNPGRARRSQPRATVAAAVGHSGDRVGSERSGPAGLGPGRCRYDTG